MPLHAKPFDNHLDLLDAIGLTALLDVREGDEGSLAIVGPIPTYSGFPGAFAAGRVGAQRVGWRGFLKRDDRPAGICDFPIDPGSRESLKLALRSDPEEAELYLNALELLRTRLADERYEVRLLSFPGLFLTAVWAMGPRSYFVPTRLSAQRPTLGVLDQDEFITHVRAVLAGREGWLTRPTTPDGKFVRRTNPPGRTLSKAIKAVVANSAIS